MKSQQEKEAFRDWVKSYQRKDRFPNGLKWLVALNITPLVLIFIYVSVTWFADTSNWGYTLLLQWTTLAVFVMVPVGVVLAIIYMLRKWKRLERSQRLICIALISLQFLTTIPFFIWPVILLVSSI
jgi:cytochrome bd-type quinol oxidase subunit 2